jgi:hypothetical protein
VLSPDPDLLKHIPEHQRLDIVRRLTERTIETWYADNGWGPEYSYVIHERRTNVDQKQQIHSHIITPGTIPLDEAGALGRVDHVVKKPHIRDLHHTSAQVLEQEMGRVLGREQTQEILSERENRLFEQNRPRNATRQGLMKARQLYDLASLMHGMTANKKARMRRQELRVYAHYVRDERRRETREQFADQRLARQAAFDEELAELRLDDEARLNRIRSKRQSEIHIPFEIDYALAEPNDLGTASDNERYHEPNRDEIDLGF